MLPEVGHIALALALGIAIVQGIVPIIGAHYGHTGWMRVAQTTAVVQAGLVALAFTILIKSFVVSDFTVLNVVQNSHSLKPMIYKVAGAWGSHEGSLVLWVLILAVFGAAVALFADNVPLALKARTLSVQAWISIGFLSFMLLTSNPFDRVVNPPLDGQDLNPLLQDLGLVLHPPMLYLGYVGFSIVFSFAVAALIEGRIDPAWARWVRPWTLLAWMFLTGGIALGSWWAYYELGWGGWWFWDPVENVSFMPWLLGTALLHSAIVVEKRDSFKSWTILLAILTFSLSLLGTFVVRSGLLTSVHAFATDPERGLYILAFLFVSIGGSLTLYVWRAPAMERGGLFAPISRESGLLLNNMLLVVATMTVLLGTLYPLFHEALTDSKISVGPPFFNQTFVPIMLPLVLIMGIGIFLPWKRGDLLGVSSRLGVAAGISLLAALIVWYIQTEGPLLAVIALGLGFWLMVASFQEWGSRLKLGRIPLKASFARMISMPRASHGMTLAHAGLGLCIIGFVGASAWKQEAIIAAKPGDRIELAGYVLTLDRTERLPGPNYISDRATLTVTRDGAFVAELQPEKRSFFVAKTATTEAAIYSRPAGDLYVTIGDPPDETSGTWTVRAIYEPLVGFIWLGSVMLIGGGALSLSDRRLRVGAPKRAAPKVEAVLRRERFEMVIARRKWLVRALPLLGFLVVGSFFLWGLNPDRDPRDIPSVLINQPPPKFIVPTITGMETGGLSTSDLPSPRPTLVNIFASWCVPCQAEHAVLTRMAKDHGIRLLGINYKDKPEDASSWLGRLGNPYERIGADELGRVGIEWGVSGVPETFILAADGMILHRVVGPILGEQEQKVLAILKESRS